MKLGWRNEFVLGYSSAVSFYVGIYEFINCLLC